MGQRICKRCKKSQRRWSQLKKKVDNFGGVKVDAGHAGITTDIEGDRRWTISAFDTRKHNKKETPQISEVINTSKSDEYQPALGINEPEKTAYICAWCDVDKSITKKYKAQGWSTSHGICRKHRDDMVSGKMNEGPVNLKELIFQNNAGVMEVFQFFEKASNEEKTQFDSLINAGQQPQAWALIEKVLSLKFQGDGPWVPGTA